MCELMMKPTNPGQVQNPVAGDEGERIRHCCGALECVLFTQMAVGYVCVNNWGEGWEDAEPAYLQWDPVADGSQVVAEVNAASGLNARHEPLPAYRSMAWHNKDTAYCSMTRHKKREGQPGERVSRHAGRHAGSHAGRQTGREVA